MNKILLFLLILTSSYIYSEQVLWELALSGEVVQTPIARGQNELILICEDRRVYSINVDRGTINWKQRIGGKLREVLLSPDGSIILRDDNNLYSLYSNGGIRWKVEVLKGFQSDIVISDRGEIIFSSDNNIIIVDRFGIKRDLKESVNILSLDITKNSLILLLKKSSLKSITIGGKAAWELSLDNEASGLKAVIDGFIIFYIDGSVKLYSNSGEILKSWDTGNPNPTILQINKSGDYLLKGDLGVSLISSEGITLFNKDDRYGLTYFGDLLIQSYSDWSLKATSSTTDSLFYASGEKQILKTTISLSNQSVWGDDENKEFYREGILDGERYIQNTILDKIDNLIGSYELLDEFPNFYNTLLLAASSSNPNSDTRQKAYLIIAKSRDISFLPYLLSDLESEDSYHVLPYIYYAIGQIGVDRTGEVISLINSRIDDYYDEKVVINALYALYNINKYNNGEFIAPVYLGIEKILTGGYSRNIKNRCYDIIKKIK